MFSPSRALGSLSDATRRALARDAFAHTAAYDAAIVTWFDETADEPETLPPTIHLALEHADVLRYGENPHQQGARYRRADQPGIWDAVEQHSGVALSYLNFFDADAAWRLAHDLGEQPAVAIMKHANPWCRRRRRSRLGVPTGIRMRPAFCVRRHRRHQPGRGSRHRRGDGRCGTGRCHLGPRL